MPSSVPPSPEPASGVTLDFTGSVLQWNVNSVAGNVTNAGTLTISGTRIWVYRARSPTPRRSSTPVRERSRLAANGTMINNEPGATFNFQADGTLNNANGETDTSFNNAGTLEKSAGSGISVISTPREQHGRPSRATPVPSSSAAAATAVAPIPSTAAAGGTVT